MMRMVKARSGYLTEETPGGSRLHFSYEVTEAQAKNNIPKFIDLSGKWNIKVGFEKTLDCPADSRKEEVTFTEAGLNDGGYFYERDQSCNIVKEVHDDEPPYSESAYSDTWFFDYNHKKYNVKGGMATLQQLNSRITWKDDDDGLVEFVRWSYIPAGKDGNQGTLYRFKENKDGTVSHTFTYTRAN